MGRIIALPLLLGLLGCSDLTSEQHATLRTTLTIACNVDGVIIPLALPVVAAAGPKGSTIAQVDVLLHPAVVEACKALHGVPASASTPSAPETTTPRG